MCTNKPEINTIADVKKAIGKELAKEFEPIPHKCGYCGSTSPLVTPEEMYGPGATGWDCCPDCGGV